MRGERCSYCLAENGGHAWGCRRPETFVGPPRPCVACRLRPGARRYGLCDVCWHDRAVRGRHLPVKHATEEEDPPQRPRPPGGAAHACLWCGLWVVGRPLAVCGDCEREYAERAAAMPEGDVAETMIRGLV